jgi:hypothetical protein
MNEKRHQLHTGITDGQHKTVNPMKPLPAANVISTVQVTLPCLIRGREIHGTPVPAVVTHLWSGPKQAR